MNPLFINDFVEELESQMPYYIKVVNQSQVKNILEEEIDNDNDNFPMLCYEQTMDSSEYVDIDDSKFLNDSVHEGKWIVASNEDDEVAFIINLKDLRDNLEIDAFEVNDKMRGEGIGSNVVSLVEYVSGKYYQKIMISPFDTDAINFWEKNDYEEIKNGYWSKDLEYEF